MKKAMLCIIMLACLVMTLPVSAADRGEAVFIYKPVDDAIGAGDQALITRLTSLGFKVTPVIDEASTADIASAADFVYISESCSSANVKEKFNAVATPMLICEMAAWEDLGIGVQTNGVNDVTTVKLTGSSEIENAVAVKEFDIFGADNTAVVVDASTVSAAAIPVGIDDNGNYMYAAYEAGAALTNGSSAPARRAGGYIYAQTAEFFTADAWTLFDAVVNWLSPIPAPETTAPLGNEEAPDTAAEEAPSVDHTAVTAAQTFDIIAFAVAAAALSAFAVSRKR